MLSKAGHLLFVKRRVSRIRKEGNLLSDRKRKGKIGRKANSKKGKIMEDKRTDEIEADRISELPEHLLHHILYLLGWPKDIARTSVWSKKWKVIWQSFSSFDFDQAHFQSEKGDNKWEPLPVEEQTEILKQLLEIAKMEGLTPLLKFILFVEVTLGTRLKPLPSVEKFRLRLTMPFGPLCYSYINNWIVAAIERNVKELEIHLPITGFTVDQFTLPQVIFSSKSITSLKLSGGLVVPSDGIMLPNLRNLSMKRMLINEKMVQDFVRDCPMIEDMRLIYCYGLGLLHVSSLPRLNRLELHEGSRLRSVIVESPSLETFLYHGKQTSRCKLLLAGCRNLKILTLRHPHLPDKSIHEFISFFPFLESLFLLECHALRRITILSDKLKKLSLIRCQRLKESNIDAPSLLSLEYNGAAELPFSSMNTSQLQEVKLHLNKQYQQFHPDQVQELIKGFDSKGFSLFLASEQEVNIYEEFERIHLLPSEVYKIEVTKSARILGNLFNSHLRDFHPKTLTLKTSPSSDLLKFVKEEVMNKEKSPSCCKYYSKKCWRHYLEDVKMFEFSESTLNPTARLELKWRSARLPLPEVVEVTEINELNEN